MFSKNCFPKELCVKQLSLSFPQLHKRLKSVLIDSNFTGSQSEVPVASL